MKPGTSEPFLAPSGGLRVRTPVYALIAAAIGLLTGALTLAGQSVLDEDWNRLANSGAVWVTVAFAVGSWAPGVRWAALAGLGTLVLAVAGYQVAATLAATGMASSAVLIWTGTALLGGPVFGAAGWHWRSGTGRRRSLAAALLGGVFVAEGLSTVLAIPRLAVTGWVEASVGLVITLALARTSQERLQALLLLVPLGAAGLLGYELLNRLFLAG